MKNNSNNYPDVVITAGGTREKIDDVRYIGNFSGGKLGHELASAYSQLGHHVLLLAPQMVIDRFGQIESIEHRPYTSAEDLQTALLSVPAARLVLHAAAVADYTPMRVEGKISSDQDELTIKLVRTPKIIAGLREHFGERTKIAGFKLLSGVAETDLIDAATQQIAINRTDLCIANDLQELAQERRLHVVQPSGNYTTMVGQTSEIAIQLAHIVEVPHGED